jgi:hypothetical protein
VAIDPYVLYIKARDRLGTITKLGGNIYDGVVPTSLPKDVNGYIKPYVVIFAGTGGDLLGETSYTQETDMDVLSWPFQTTVVAADVISCMRLGHDVRIALTNHPVLGGFIRPDGYSETGALLPQRDDQVTPARFFLPLQWRITTT